MSRKNIMKFRRTIRNIGIVNVFFIPLYTLPFSKLAETSPTSYVEAIQRIIGYSAGFTLICLLQYRCPDCGSILSPRKYLHYRCPYCEGDLS